MGLSEVFRLSGWLLPVAGAGAMLWRRERAHAERSLAALDRVGRTLAAELDLKRLVQVLTDETTRMVGAEFGAFFYNVVEKGESYLLYTVSGVPIEAFSKFPMPRKTEVFGPTFDGEGIVFVLLGGGGAGGSKGQGRDPRF